MAFPVTRKDVKIDSATTYLFQANFLKTHPRLKGRCVLLHCYNTFVFRWCAAICGYCTTDISFKWRTAWQQL